MDPVSLGPIGKVEAEREVLFGVIQGASKIDIEVAVAHFQMEGERNLVRR